MYIRYVTAGFELEALDKEERCAGSVDAAFPALLVGLWVRLSWSGGVFYLEMVYSAFFVTLTYLFHENPRVTYLIIIKTMPNIFRL